MATLRRETRIHRPADEVWTVAGRPELLHLWFPGIVDCTVDGTTRIITTGAGDITAAGPLALAALGGV